MRGRGLEPQVRPPLEDAVGVDVVDDDELRPARRAGHQAHVPSWHVELVREESQQRLIGCTLHGRRRHPRAQDPIGNPIDVVRPTTGRQADGKADVGRTQINL